MMKIDHSPETSAINDIFEEITCVSNLENGDSAYSECIRKQMVKFNINYEATLNITESDLRTNNNSFSMNFYSN